MTAELQNPDWLLTRRLVLVDLLRSGRHSDLSLVTADQRTVRAHQAVLSTASPGLRNILLEHSEPSPVITVAGMTHTELLSLLLFVYTGEVRCGPGPENRERFSQTARQLGLWQSGLEEEEEEEEEIADLDQLLEDEEFIRDVTVEAESEMSNQDIEGKVEDLKLIEELNLRDDSRQMFSKGETKGNSKVLRFRCGFCDKLFPF